MDDLQSIDKLEEDVDATILIMIFVSAGYFKSKSACAHIASTLAHAISATFFATDCLREAKCTVEKGKPLVLVHDSAAYLSTFMPLDKIREECPYDLRAAIWDGRNVIEWHRIQATAAHHTSLPAVSHQPHPTLD